MSGKEKIYLNALNRLLVGDVARMEKLLNFYGNTEQAFQEYSKTAEQKVSPEEEWTKLEKEKITIITREDDSFPKLLREIQIPPLLLYTKGEVKPEEFALAIVGTRKATRYGKEVAATLARELASFGIAIVSGLAIGIDAEAHKGVLEVGGRTIAVLGSGLNRASLFPQEHLGLAEQILSAGGALISEYAPGTPALPYRILARNRIISGLSKGVIVVEAPLRSGALVTARHAAEQGREVFAVPGEIHSHNFQGAHKLIQEGAKLVTSIDDVLEEFGVELKEKKKAAVKLEGDERTLFTLLERAPRALEELVAETHLDTPRVLAALSMLELKGLVKNVGDGRYAPSKTI